MTDSRRRKRIARMGTFREQAAAWAQRQHADELLQSIRCWIGPHPTETMGVLEGVTFALVTGHGDGRPSLIARFAEAHPPRARVERRLVEAWSSAWFGVFEFISVVPGESLLLEDVVTGATFGVREASGSSVLMSGDWALFFVMEVDGQYELEGTGMALTATGRLAAVQAMLAGLRELGLEPDPEALTPAHTRRLAPAVVAAARQTERPPHLVNRDGHDVVALRTRLALDWHAFVATTTNWPDIAHHDRDASTWIGRHDKQMGGPLSLVSFHRQDAEQGEVLLMTNSVERLDALRDLWLERVGIALPEVEDALEIKEVESNPEGPDILMDTSLVTSDPRSTADIERDVFRQIGRGWLDSAMPSLDGLSPRQAVAAGRKAEVRALLPATVSAELVRDLREELAI